ncbi:MAG: NDP-sugar synthase [Burkholderiales bacterium]|nr:NDP-sugar synthase [Burkholderiales bacterium]
MKALILAAGKGTRVMPLTDSCPKPMLRILDTPVLELLVAQLRAHGVNQIMINTAHHAEVIERYFGDGRRFGVDIAYSFEGHIEDGVLVGEPIGSAAALKRIQAHSGFFDDTFMVVCGDAIVDLDISALVAAHHRHGALATLALQAVDPSMVGHYGVVALDDEGRVTQFQEKPSPSEALSNLVNTGVYVFEPAVLDHIPADIPCDLGTHVFPTLAQRGEALYGVSLPMTWLDIGRREDFHQVCQRALRGEVPGMVLPGHEMADGIRLGLNVRINLRRCHITGPVVIAGSATVEDGATLIGPTYIGAGAVIERGARVERSVVQAHARVGSHANLVDVVSDGRYCLARDGTVLDLTRADMPWLLSDARVPRAQRTASEQRFLSHMH